MLLIRPGRKCQEGPIHLMHEVLSSNLDLKNGENILSVKLIFLEGLCMMKMVTTNVVLLFLSRKNVSRLSRSYVSFDLIDV